MICRAATLLLGIVALAHTAWAWDPRAEAGIEATAGPDGYLETAADLSLEPLDQLLMWGRVASVRFDGDTGTDGTAGAELRPADRMRVSGEYGRSSGPGAFDRTTWRLGGGTTVLPGAGPVGAVHLDVTVERTEHTVTVARRRWDLVQEGLGLDLRLEVGAQVEVSATWWTYRYDRDLDSVSRRLLVLSRRRRLPVFADTSSYVSELPLRAWGAGVDLYPATGIRVGYGILRTEGEVGVEWGDAWIHRLDADGTRGRLRVGAGVEIHARPDGTDTYVSARLGVLLP